MRKLHPDKRDGLNGPNRPWQLIVDIRVPVRRIASCL
jgi:hypothetical protein